MTCIPFTFRKIAGMLLAATGISLLATDGDLSMLKGITFSIGDVWARAVAAAQAGYGVLVKSKPDDLSRRSFWASLVVLRFAFLTPWYLWEHSHDGTFTFPTHSILAIIHLGVGPLIPAFLRRNGGVLEIRPTQTAFVYCSQPVFYCLAAYIFLGEPIHWIHPFDGALIIVAVLMATVPVRNGQDKGKPVS